MAPHTEKSQLISKPAARRGGSKSPSKITTENDEMPQKSSEPATPRKVSIELPQQSVPSRKVSAPELGKPSVTKGARRNLFVERCISQEEKENLKSKPPMRKFSTPSLSNTIVSDKNIIENIDANSLKVKISHVKPTETSNVEVSKPVVKLPIVKTQEICHIEKPQLKEHVSIPKNIIPVYQETKESSQVLY